MMIKRILLSLALVSLAMGGGWAQTIEWHTFEEAMALSEKKPKKIFIDVYTDWCSWCKVMDNKTFGNPKIAAYMNQHFYNVKLNAEGKAPIMFKEHKFENKGTGRRPTHDLAVSLLQGNMSYPSVVFMNEKYELMQVIPGYKTPEQFAPIMVYLAEDHYQSQSWEEFNKTFKWE